MCNPRRHEVQAQFSVTGNDCVSRVVAPVVTDNQVRGGSQRIDNLPFSFVSPVTTNYRYYRHR